MTPDESHYHQLGFWRNAIVTAPDRERFVSSRVGSYDELVHHFPSLGTETGLGLDVGCGPLCRFEFSTDDHNVVACDVLAVAYQQLLPARYHVANIPTVQADDHLPFRDNSFAWVLSHNMLDQTANPTLLLQEIRRVLQPDGKFYLCVNFDTELRSCHYELWDEALISKRLALTEVTHTTERRNDGSHNGSFQCYYGVWRK